MSDNGVPTPEPSSSLVDAPTAVPARVATKAPKLKGLTWFNRVAVALLLILVASTVALFYLAAERTREKRDIEAETVRVQEQTAAILAPRWCEKITAENAADMKNLSDEYYDASATTQRAIDKECSNRVTIARLVGSNDDPKSFLTNPGSCTIDASGTSASCTVEVSVRNSELKEKLAAFPSTTVTLRMWLDDTQFFLGTPDHVIESVATATLVGGENATVEFTVAYDESWGSYYGFEVASFFPNE